MLIESLLSTKSDTCIYSVFSHLGLGMNVTPFIYTSRTKVIYSMINFCLHNILPDFKAQDSSGDTPLHWAVRGNSSDALHCLVYAGADLSELNNHKMTPLHLACQLNLPDMVEVGRGGH